MHAQSDASCVLLGASLYMTPHKRGQGRVFHFTNMQLATTLVFLCATAAAGLGKPRLVYPRILEGRSSEGKLVLHIHDDLMLNLERASVAAPQLRVLKEEDRASVTQMYDGQEINSNLYQDQDRLATVALNIKEKTAEVTGIVGPNHRIEPLRTMGRSKLELIPHMVHEIKHAKVFDRALSFLEKVNGSRFSARNSDGKTSVPQEVRVEVFIVADKPHHKSFKDTRAALVYICILMNSVNLRMTDMRSPMVKLVLTGMEQPTTEEFLQGTSDLMHSSRTIKEFRTYATNKKADFGNPDIVYLLSGRDVVTDGSDGKLNRNAAGISYVAGICTTFFVGLGEDAPGLFTGMLTMTHEVAHLLGSEHDGSGPYPYIDGHPGARGCLWEYGYLMSYVDKGPNHHQFSSCSIRQMQYVLKLRGQDCWAVVSTTHNVSKKYPGYRNIIKRICVRAFPNIQNVEAEVVKPRGNECKLKCHYSVREEYYTKTYFILKDVPDYTPCGNSMACVRGYCVYANIPRKTIGGREHVAAGTAAGSRKQLVSKEISDTRK
uniref:Reprolysin n=1 Tax=Rhipicephalus zambeziensis TaxID=60191 RepID=A0A224YQ27_9ACAR